MRRRDDAGGPAARSRRRASATRKSAKAPTGARRRKPSDPDLKAELHAALEREAAAAEVLRVIAGSSGELAPVFETMLANATRLCEAKFGNLWLREGDSFRIAAAHGAPRAYQDHL